MPPVPSHSGNANVAEICNQVLMMLSHEIFDPEFGERVLIDQAFIVAGGEITKQALNWARQRTRRLTATVDHLHGRQRHPGLVRSEQPSLARVRGPGGRVLCSTLSLSMARDGKQADRD
jgi:hypothetical protein